MPSYNRKDFIKTLSIALLPLFFPIRLIAHGFSGNTNQPKIHPNPYTNLEDKCIVDLHCHLSLKHMLFWRLKIWKHHMFAHGGENDIWMQNDIYRIEKGKVRGMIVAHHLPEWPFIQKAEKLHSAYKIVKTIKPHLANAIERNDEGNFKQLLGVMDEFTRQIRIANTRSVREYVIATSYQDFFDNINKGKICLAHAIEGVHALGRNMKTSDGAPDTQKYLDNLYELQKRGVCMITLSHFFMNDISYPCEGIEPSSKHKIKLCQQYNPEIDDRPLTALGELVVGEMLHIGIVVDLTHTTPKGRMRVFEINRENGYNRPVIFSHTGARRLFHGPEKYKNYGDYCVSDDEIKEIVACDGLIGIVFENYWLTGIDATMHKELKRAGTRYSRKELKNGVDNIIKTIEYIHYRTGNYRNIALGSDFDGFANTPPDLKNPSVYHHLVDRLRDNGLTNEEIGMITHGNALRVLEYGWGDKKK